jgi:hypothetical protein
MYRKKNSVLLKVDRSIIENNLLIQVKSIPITKVIIRVCTKFYELYRITNMTDCMQLTYFHAAGTTDAEPERTLYAI